MNRELDVVLGGCSFLEAPRWRDGRLWVSDYYRHRVLAVDPRTRRAEVVAEVPGQPSGLGWLPDGRLLVVSMLDAHLLRQEPSGALVLHADLSGFVGGELNDMVVDAAGRAYVGNFGCDLMGGEPIRPTVLVRVDPDGTASVAAKDVLFPNGTVIIGGHTLVLAETFEYRLTAFDLAADGALTRRRVWAPLAEPADRRARDLPADPRPVAPDGICVDAEGAIWVADVFHHRVVRVRAGGEVLDEVSTGDVGAYACALGGDDGRTLFVCAARSFLQEERRTVHASELLACRVDVPGVPLG
jgi:sugar lactone lactonase YvrE